MKFLRDFFGEPPREPADLAEAEDEASLAAASALIVALERRDQELDLAPHCARVAAHAERMAVLLDVEPEHRAVLRHASLLHEVGMIGVPGELLSKPGVLTHDELQRVRDQAALGAEIARATCGPLAATVIRHQYDDYVTLRQRLDGEALVLAGILRIADVVEAITRPRPYQAPLPARTRIRLLRAGAGSHFDPSAVEAYMDSHRHEGTELT
ncbi:MAG TPA: HD domain-containing phosphohydrolase [Longimicrobium sp.]